MRVRHSPGPRGHPSPTAGEPARRIARSVGGRIGKPVLHPVSRYITNSDPKQTNKQTGERPHRAVRLVARAGDVAAHRMVALTLGDSAEAGRLRLCEPSGTGRKFPERTRVRSATRCAETNGTRPHQGRAPRLSAVRLAGGAAAVRAQRGCCAMPRASSLGADVRRGQRRRAARTRVPAQMWVDPGADVVWCRCRCGPIDPCSRGAPRSMREQGRAGRAGRGTESGARRGRRRHDGLRESLILRRRATSWRSWHIRALGLVRAEWHGTLRTPAARRLLPPGVQGWTHSSTRRRMPLRRRWWRHVASEGGGGVLACTEPRW